MFFILTYDVGARRNSKVLKICRKNLTHVQKSVFEGNVNEKQLRSLKSALAGNINFELDQIAIYKYVGRKNIEKEVIGYHITTDNII